MSESKSVILNGQVLHGNDRLGHWKVTRLDGWGDSPPVRSQDVGRANADGDYDLPSHFGARLVTIGGRVVCSSQAAAQLARARLTGLVRGLVRAQVMDEGVTTWADVKLTDAIMTKRVGSLVRFQYQLRAPDSRRYGQTQTFVASVGASAQGIYHKGNYDATPRFVVAGDMPGGYTLTIKGLVFNVTQPLVAGQPHSIDYGDGRLRINGAIVHGGIGYGFTPLVTPGIATVLAIVPRTTGTATATLTLIDTYI